MPFEVDGVLKYEYMSGLDFKVGFPAGLDYLWHFGGSHFGVDFLRGPCLSFYIAWCEPTTPVNNVLCIPSAVAKISCADKDGGRRGNINLVL